MIDLGSHTRLRSVSPAQGGIASTQTQRNLPGIEPPLPPLGRPDDSFAGLFEPPWLPNEFRGEKKLPWSYALPLILVLSLVGWAGIWELVRLI